MTYKGFNVSSIEAVILLDILAKLNDIAEKLGDKTKENVPAFRAVSLTPEVKILSVDEPAETISSITKKVCKTCGGTHDKAFEYALCARKNKKV